LKTGKLDFRNRISGTGFPEPDFGNRISGTGFPEPDFGNRISGTGTNLGMSRIASCFFVQSSLQAIGVETVLSEIKNSA
jgi:hypothetical protein